MGATTTLSPSAIRETLIRAILDRGSGHLGASLSVCDIIYSYFASSAGRDPEGTFVLSKGHAAPALYAVLDYFGLVEEMFTGSTLRRIGSPFSGHPRASLVGPVPCSTGSLGLGLSFGVGLAFAHLRNGRRSARVTVLCSDAELQCGISYEAVCMISRYPSLPLTLLVDWNDRQCSGELVSSIRPPVLLGNLGLSPEVVSGHNVTDLVGFLNRKAEGVRVGIAQTQRGRGIPSIEGGPEVYGEGADEALLSEFLYHDGA